MSNPAKAATQPGDDEDENLVETNDEGEAEETDADEEEEDLDEGNEAEAEEPEDEDEDEEDEDEEPQGKTFESKVNAALKAAKVDAKGNLVLPKGLSEEVRYAAVAEKRRRDTQAEFTRTKQETKRLKAEKAALANKVRGSVKLELTAEQKDELDELKFADPEAWRVKMNNLEREAIRKADEEIEKELKQVSTSSLEQDELERRKQLLADFNQEHPGVVIDDDVIANDIPPRITNKLKNGEIEFEDFLQEVHKYLKTGKVVKQTERTRKQPNLARVPGGSSPEKQSNRQDPIKSYDTEVF